MTQQQAQQAADNELAEAMREKFPVELIHEEFEYWASRLMANHTPNGLGISWEAFKRLKASTEDISISEMGACLNAITGTSESQFSNPQFYVPVMDWAYPMVEEWHKIFNATRKRIEGKYSTMMSLATAKA